MDLTSHSAAAAIQDVTVKVEVRGKLKLKGEKEITELPISVDADLRYAERIMAATLASGKFRVVRHYSAAESRVTLGEGGYRPKLSSEHRLLAIDGLGDRLDIFSPAGPLSREEIDLIDVPASSALVAGLLPGKAVQPGSQWKPTDALLARLLGIDVVQQHEVQATLLGVEKDLAVVELAGPVSGAVEGVATEINLKVKYRFDLRTRQITAVTFSIGEDRSIGHAEPGFTVTATITMTIKPLSAYDKLSDDALAGVSLSRTDGTPVLFTATHGGFKLLSDPRWRVMSDRPEATVLRFIDRGDLLAQCNVTRLTDAADDRKMTLVQFRQQAQTALGEHFVRFVHEEEGETDAGLRVLRLVAAGRSSDLPIQWIYYHLSSPHGRQVTLTIAVEESLVERYQSAERLLVESLEFTADGATALKNAPAPATK